MATTAMRQNRSTVSGPTLRWEQRAWRSGKSVVAGVDEVGRGAWAGPLVAAAVALPSDSRQRARITRALNRVGAHVRDSKMLSASQRRAVTDAIADLDIPSSIVEVSVSEIDAIGLGRANHVALRRAIHELAPFPDHALVDCFRVPELNCTHDAIVRGDNASVSIALASIIAKLHRDEVMARIGDEYPDWAFSAHKGYGTALHRERLIRHGLTAHHRRSFAPVARMAEHEPPAS